MRIRTIIHLSAAAAALTGAAFAGTFTPIGATGGSYGFTECARPGEPDLAIDPALKGAEKRKARNASVDRYNAYIVEVNAYFACISGEAERDLQTYYSAVTATLDAEQSALMARAEALRAALD